MGGWEGGVGGGEGLWHAYGRVQVATVLPRVSLNGCAGRCRRNCVLHPQPARDDQRVCDRRSPRTGACGLQQAPDHIAHSR